MTYGRPEQFDLFANTVEDNYRFRIQGIFAANRALSRAITTSASSMGGEFPHFSVPAFESHAFESRQLAGFETITYAPIGIRIDQWLDFANKSRGWLDESKDIFDKPRPLPSQSGPRLRSRAAPVDSISIDASPSLYET